MQRSKNHSHKINFARAIGESSSDKIKRVQAKLKGDALVVTALDEVAWLFNLRSCPNPSWICISTLISAIFKKYFFLP